MVPKDKGWGMSNLGLWGKNPCLSPLLICHLFVSPNLVNLFNAQLVVEELWLRAFIAKVVVVVGGCQPYPIAHSTHVGHSSPSRTLPFHGFSPLFSMVGCSHAWSVHLMHWSVHAHAQARILTQKSGMSFPCILLLVQVFPHAQTGWGILSM